MYGMMIRGFQIWWVSAFYLIAQALLFLHLSHGLASLFQSLGLRNSVWWPRVTLLARVVASCCSRLRSIPVAVLSRGWASPTRTGSGRRGVGLGKEVVR